MGLIKIRIALWVKTNWEHKEYSVNDYIFRMKCILQAARGCWGGWACGFCSLGVGWVLGVFVCWGGSSLVWCFVGLVSIGFVWVG